MTSTDYRISPDAPVRNTKAFTFAADVVDGRIVSGKRRIQACHRFLRELERAEIDQDYPWRFDTELGYRPVRFIEKFMVPTKGNYDRMELLPWQHFIEANLYGWVSRETGLRRFREALILVGQGNGKSTLITGNAAYALSKDGERGAEVYSLANSRDQARIVFGECAAQIKASRILSRHKYHVLVLKVAEGTQLILPDPDDDSDFTIGVSPSYGTHKIYNSYTICDNSKLISDAKALKEECDSIELPNNLNSQSYGTQAKEERRSEIIKTLRQLGMDYSFGGWVYPDYLDAHVLIDKEIKTKRDFIEKYM